MQALLDTASGYFGLKAQSKETLQLASSKSEEEETFSVNIGISKVCFSLSFALIYLLKLKLSMV